MWAEIVEQIGLEPMPGDFPDTPEGIEEFERANDGYRRLISKTDAFQKFVDERIERTTRASSLIGNQYTGSIFLALMSAMESDYIENIDMSGEMVGLCGYGSSPAMSLLSSASALRVISRASASIAGSSSLIWQNSRELAEEPVDLFHGVVVQYTHSEHTLRLQSERLAEL